MSRPRNAKGQFVKMVPATAITAAASVIPQGQIRDLPRGPTGLQARAWRLWRMLGVINFPTSFKAKQVGRLKWNVVVNGNQLEPEQADDAIKAISTPLSPAETSRRLALSLEVSAEVFYARINDEWNVFTSTKNKLKQLLEDADIVVRGLQPDPEEPSEPFCPLMAALGTADQIRLMAAMSRGQDRNRLAQRGILLVPKEGQFPEDDPFEATLQAAMTAPIADEYAASAVVPPVVHYPGEYIEKWRHLVLESPYDDKLMDRIEKSITQLAIELDMPPEMLLGNMDSNHWNAWLSSEENYRAHVEPLGVLVGEVYAEAMMEAASEGEFAGAEIEVTPDPADLLSKSPDLADVFKAAEIGAVGLVYVRRALGADEDDAPTEEETELLLRMLGRGAAEPEDEPSDEQAPPEMPAEIPAPPSTNGRPVTAAVDEDTQALDQLARRLTDIDIRLLSMLEGAAGMAVDQARQAAKVSDEVNRDSVIAAAMQRLGRSWDREVTHARNALQHLGIDSDGIEWDQAQERSVARLVDDMTVFVTDNLDRTDSEAPAIPVLVLRQVLALAGGSGETVVAAIIKNPAPTFADPQGFAVGVLPLKALKGQDVELVQWRFRYGPATRTEPFQPHKDVDGQFMTSDGYTNAGWYPGDHKGCECFTDPVFRKAKSPVAAREEVDVS